MMLVGAWDILDRDVDGHLVKFGSVEYDSSFLHQLDDATTLLGLDRREGGGAHDAVLLSPGARGPDRRRLAGVRPVARRPHQLAVPRLPRQTTRVATR